jgi:hypothetical protein
LILQNRIIISEEAAKKIKIAEKKKLTPKSSKFLSRRAIQTLRSRVHSSIDGNMNGSLM